MQLIGWGIGLLALGVIAGAAGLVLAQGASEYVRALLLFGAWVFILMGLVITGFCIANQRKQTMI